LHTAEVEAVILTELVIMETLETWDKVWETRMAEVQAEAEALEEIGSTAVQVEAEALEEPQVLEEILLQATVLAHQDIRVDLVGVQEHLAEHQDQTTAGHLGLEWADLAEKVFTELQAEAAEVEASAVEDLVAEELEDLKQLITLVAQVEMEQAQVVEETTTNQELATREVLA
jgi:hypothetical protein